MAVTRVAWRQAVVVAAALVAPGARSAMAQDQPRAADGRPWFVAAAKWGRWPTLAAAVGLTAMAIVRKADADDYFNRLESRCRDQPDDCVVGPNGAYTNPGAEALYQETLRLDGQARNWMVGGQSFLFVSGALFVIDLVAGSRKPENIPFTPFQAYATPGTVGLRWRF